MAFTAVVLLLTVLSVPLRTNLFLPVSRPMFNFPSTEELDPIVRERRPGLSSKLNKVLPRPVRIFFGCGIITAALLVLTLLFNSKQGDAIGGMSYVAAGGPGAAALAPDEPGQQLRVEQLARALASFSFAGHGVKPDLDCAGYVELFAVESEMFAPRHSRNQPGGLLRGKQNISDFCDSWMSTTSHFANQVDTVIAIKFASWHAVIKYDANFEFKDSAYSIPMLAHAVFNDNLQVVWYAEYVYTSQKQRQNAKEIEDLTELCVTNGERDCETYTRLFAHDAVGHEPPAIAGGKYANVAGADALRDCCNYALEVVSYNRMDYVVAQKILDSNGQSEAWSAMVEYRTVYNNQIIKAIAVLDFDTNKRISSYYDFFTL
eukprot:g7130.t1